SEAELLEPGRFAWTGRYPLTTYLGANTASHYAAGSKILRRYA
ncbi:MAG: ClbS/DfsB family four-helix bundle protein, partial [Phycisphaerales bacterium]|nr:ClbS/DfsB family four-helix bundle protein [Phycisphaerales bacterium]